MFEEAEDEKARRARMTPHSAGGSPPIHLMAVARGEVTSGFKRDPTFAARAAAAGVG